MKRRVNRLRVGIGGPVGSGKTALTLALCRALRDRFELAVVTNDIYTEEDAQFLVRNEALAADRIIGVETGGCPHTAIREDASINLEAVDRLARALRQPRHRVRRERRRQPGGDVLARAVRSHALRDRRRRRRQDSAQGRAGHHALGSARHQQDRPRADGRRVARGDGARRAADARRASVRVHEPQDRARGSTRSSASSSSAAWSARPS